MRAVAFQNTTGTAAAVASFSRGGSPCARGSVAAVQFEPCGWLLRSRRVVLVLIAAELPEPASCPYGARRRRVGWRGDPEGFVRSRGSVAKGSSTPQRRWHDVSWSGVASGTARMRSRIVRGPRVAQLPQCEVRYCRARLFRRGTHKPNLLLNLTRGCCEARRASRPPRAARRRASRCGGPVNPAQVSSNYVGRTKGSHISGERSEDAAAEAPQRL